MAGGGEVPRGHDGDDQLARFQRLHQLFAVLAGLATGYWDSRDAILKNQTTDRIFTPKIQKEERDFKIKMWKRAVSRSFAWEGNV